MQKHKALIAGGLAALFLATSISSASAQYYHYHHRGPGPVLGLVGGVIAGAATIATLPFSIVGAAVHPGYYGPLPAYGYGPAYAYGPPPPPPRSYYPRPYGPPGYYGY